MATTLALAPRRRLALLLQHYSVVDQHERVAGPLSLPCGGRRAVAVAYAAVLGLLRVLGIGRTRVGAVLGIFLATEALGFHVLGGGMQMGREGKGRGGVLAVQRVPFWPKMGASSCEMGRCGKKNNTQLAW